MIHIVNSVVLVQTDGSTMQLVCDQWSLLGGRFVGLNSLQELVRVARGIVPEGGERIS